MSEPIFVDLADGGGTQPPDDLHDFEFESGQRAFGSAHTKYLVTKVVFKVKAISAIGGKVGRIPVSGSPVVEHGQWIDPRRPPGRKITGQKCDERERRQNDEERQRIGWRDAPTADC